MQRPIATFGFILAISSTAVSATPGDAAQATYQHHPDTALTAPSEGTSSQLESTIVDNERTTARIARDDPRYAWRDQELDSNTHRTPHYDRRHPQNGQMIDRGLFNRTGPNDFGA